jgi:hypothetical protein
VDLLALLSNPALTENLQAKAAQQPDEVAGSVSERPRQRQVRLTRQQLDELVERYQAGACVRELVSYFGVHRVTVVGHLKQRGVERRGHVRKLTDAQVQQAVQSYQAGESLARIGARYQVHSETIRREFRKVGVATRSR